MERIAPLAKILAEANGIDWQKLHGTGEGGLIVEQDILNYLSRIMSGEEEPPATPVDAPPADWTGSMPSADLLKGAGVDSDIASFVEQARPVSPQVPAMPNVPNLDQDALEFELDDDEPVSTSASIIDISGVPAVGAAPNVPEVPAPAPHAPAAGGWDWNAPAPAAAPPEFKLPETPLSVPQVEAPNLKAPSFDLPNVAAAPSVAAPSFDLPQFDLPSTPTVPEVAAQAPALGAAEALGGGVAAVGLGSLLSQLYHKDETPSRDAQAPAFTSPSASSAADIHFDTPSAPVPQLEIPTFGAPHAEAPASAELPAAPELKVAEVQHAESPAASHAATDWMTPSVPAHTVQTPSLELETHAAPAPAAPVPEQAVPAASAWDWNAPAQPVAPVTADDAAVHEAQVQPEPEEAPAHEMHGHEAALHEAPVQAEATPAPVTPAPVTSEPAPTQEADAHLAETPAPAPVQEHDHAAAAPTPTAAPTAPEAVAHEAAPAASAEEPPAESAPVAPVAVSAEPPTPQPADAVWFGTYLRREANLDKVSDLHSQLVGVLGRDVPLAFLVARAAQRHLGTLGLHHVALHDSQTYRTRTVQASHLRDAVSALDTDHDGTPDLLVVDAAAHGLDDLHYPHTTTLSVGRMQDGQATLSLNGKLDTAQAARFLAQVADTLQEPLVLVL